MGKGKMISKGITVPYEKPKEVQDFLKFIVMQTMEMQPNIDSGYATHGIANKGFWYCWRNKDDKGQGFIPFKKRGAQTKNEK